MSPMLGEPRVMRNGEDRGVGTRVQGGAPVCWSSKNTSLAQVGGREVEGVCGPQRSVDEREQYLGLTSRWQVDSAGSV